MPDYKKGKIYCIINEDLKNVYYGSTTQTLTKRFNQHKINSISCKRPSTSKECFKTENVKILLLQDFSCENKYALFNRERFYIEKNMFFDYKIVNKCIPNRTGKEYYLDNKDLICAKRMIKYYKHQNREKERASLYYQTHKEERLLSKTCAICGGTTNRHHQARHNKSNKHKKALLNMDIPINQEIINN